MKKDKAKCWQIGLGKRIQLYIGYEKPTIKEIPMPINGKEICFVAIDEVAVKPL